MDSLIKVPKEVAGSKNNLPAELSEIQDRKYNEALTNLITGKTPKDVVYQRKISQKASADYVPGWWFIGQLNALFGYYWDFEIEDQGIGTENCWVRGKLTVKDPNTGITVSKSSFGGSKLKSKENSAIDIGDDLKSAATDSLKKAATLLGIASDIYGKREIISETTGAKEQLNSLYEIGESRGMTKEQVDNYCREKKSSLPDELDTADILGLMTELRSSPDVVEG